MINSKKKRIGNHYNNYTALMSKIKDERLENIKNKKYKEISDEFLPSSNDISIENMYQRKKKSNIKQLFKCKCKNN